MRIGGNEYKFDGWSTVEPARITAAVVTFLPNEAGYFQRRMDVIRLSLLSLVRHAELPVDLLVFDNGSCRRLVDHLVELKEGGAIRFLILGAKNVGLAGAYRVIADAAPGEVIAFANDDVFYFPNWLSPQVRILDIFPDVGLVSGFYLRATHPRTAELAREKGLMVRTVPAPDEWIEEFCRDASYPSPEAYTSAHVRAGWTDLDDRLVSSNDTDAYAGGVCWQAVLRKETLRSLVDCPNGSWRQQHRSFDGYLHEEVVRRGLLRLSTPVRLVRHIGNVVTPEMAALAAQHGIAAQPNVGTSRPGHRHLLMRFPPSRRLAMGVYNYLYRVVKS